MVWNQPAQAQDLKPLYTPDTQTLSLEAYAQRSQTVQGQFDEDAFLSFSVDLPADWIERPFISLKNFSRQNRLYGDLLRYDGVAVGDMRSHFRVRSQELAREISAKHWLMTYLLSNGYTLYSLKEQADDNQFDAMYIIFSGDRRESQIVRSRGMISGPRIILAEYVMPMGLWETERDKQAYAVGSFTMKADDQTWVEDKKFFTYLEALEFDYPDSWVVSDKDDSALNILHVTLSNADFTKVSEGEMTVSVASNRSIKNLSSDQVFDIDLKGLIQDAKQHIADKDFTIDTPVGGKTLQLGHEFKVQKTEIYTLRPIISDYDNTRETPVTHELWLTVLVEPGRAVVTTLLTPARAQDLYSWAVNSRAYERILSELK